MKKIIISLLLSALYVHNSDAQNEVLSTNIYHKVMHVYENHMLHAPILPLWLVLAARIFFERILYVNLKPK